MSNAYPASTGSDGAGSIPLPRYRTLVESCERFEAAWPTKQRLQIEDMLVGLADPEQSTLLRMLLEIEVELRRNCGEQPRPEEYRVRFPDDATLIDSVFSNSLARSIER